MKEENKKQDPTKKEVDINKNKENKKLEEFIEKVFKEDDGLLKKIS